MKKIDLFLWHFPSLGFINASITFLLGVVFIATVVGIPLGKGLIQYSIYLFNPVKYEIGNVPAAEIDHNQHWQDFSLFVNMFYFPFSLILAVLTFAQFVILSLTFTGFPLAKSMLKQLRTCFNPVDKKCVVRIA